MTHGLHRLGWLAVLLFACVPLACPPPATGAPLGGLLLGPFAKLAAQVQWLRFQGATRHGEETRALELAESALALDPRTNGGWELLAAHLAYDLASREREPELAARRAWFAAGIAVLQRGAERVEHPSDLELFRGILLVDKAARDPELAAGGAAELLRRAREAFERAAELGDPRAGGFAAQLATQLAAQPAADGAAR